MGVIVSLSLAGGAVGCQQQAIDIPTTYITMEECHQRWETWGLECHSTHYPDGQLWYVNCEEGAGERHAETVDAVDLHDGKGFLPWCM